MSVSNRYNDFVRELTGFIEDCDRSTNNLAAFDEVVSALIQKRVTKR